MATYERLFAIEGGDGSGKGTQSKLLAESLRNEGYPVFHGSYPRYGEQSAVLVERYLRGEYGDSDKIAADLAAATFLLDRIAGANEIDAFFKENPTGIGILDRHVMSNLAHQAARIEDSQQRHAFYRDWKEREYETFGVPKPAKNFILLVPADVAQENVDKKAARSYTTAKRDIHEADASHLDSTLRNYQELAELFPDELTAIWAIDKVTRNMLPEEEVQAIIRAEIKL